MTEVLVVVAILSATALTVYPVVGNAVVDSRTRAGAEQVASALRLARQYAISTAATYQVTVAGSTIQITCTDGVPAGNVCPDNRPPDRTEPVGSGALLSPSTSPISFAPSGAATAATVAVEYGDAASWEVAVNVPGRVRTCTPSCS
jgi:Tfp pilus assembly protein FimT